MCALQIILIIICISNYKLFRTELQLLDGSCNMLDLCEFQYNLYLSHKHDQVKCLFSSGICYTLLISMIMHQFLDRRLVFSLKSHMTAL